MTTMGADGILGCRSAMSGKPEGFQMFPLEPRVQGRFAGIVMAEDVLFDWGGVLTDGLTPANSGARHALRLSMRAVRRAIPAAARIAAANGVASQLLGLPFVPGLARVAGYWSVDGEIALHAWQLALPPGVVYCLPVLHADQRLRFAPWRPGAPLTSNAHGIPEPDVEAGELLEPDAMDLVVAPLVAFDPRGHRLGMGGGWYDRSFAFRQQRSAPPFLVGVGFSAQGVEALHADSWDIDMDAICTEDRTIVPATG